jgi:hypothetical protein
MNALFNTILRSPCRLIADRTTALHAMDAFGSDFVAWAAERYELGDRAAINDVNALYAMADPLVSFGQFRVLFRSLDVAFAEDRLDEEPLDAEELSQGDWLVGDALLYFDAALKVRAA